MVWGGGGCGLGRAGRWLRGFAAVRRAGTGFGAAGYFAVFRYSGIRTVLRPLSLPGLFLLRIRAVLRLPGDIFLPSLPARLAGCHAGDCQHKHQQSTRFSSHLPFSILFI